MTTNSPLSIIWTEKLVNVNDLKDYERNPRYMSKEDFFKLKKSLKETGYHSRIKAQPDMRVIGGHYRKKALLSLGITQILVLVPDRQLTDDEFRRVMIQDNLNFGRFDTDILASDFDPVELGDWGMSDAVLGELEEDENDVGEEEEKEELAAEVCPTCGAKLKKHTE